MKRVQDGVIGDLIAGQVYWNGGGVWVRERKPEYTEMQYQMRNWYYFNWLCGDHIVEQHMFIILMFSIGLKEPILYQHRVWVAVR
jgi:myo-inositol 2-dehydrogenase/D-chiro-inositol 1-dehydrogenase